MESWDIYKWHSYIQYKLKKLPIAILEQTNIAELSQEDGVVIFNMQSFVNK